MLTDRLEAPAAVGARRSAREAKQAASSPSAARTSDRASSEPATRSWTISRSDGGREANSVTSSSEVSHTRVAGSASLSAGVLTTQGVGGGSAARDAAVPVASAGGGARSASEARDPSFDLSVRANTTSGSEYGKTA